MAEQVGLFEKYTVSRNEGTPPFQGEHFVLFPRRDRYALAALTAYAKACLYTNPQLAVDLLNWVQAIKEEVDNG